MEEETRQGARPRKEAACLCVWRQEVAAVPEIGRGGPLESQAGHIHGGVHQQEENGHNAGNGVELPGEKDQLVEHGERGKGGLTKASTMGGTTVSFVFGVNAASSRFQLRRGSESWRGRRRRRSQRCWGVKSVGMSHLCIM